MAYVLPRLLTKKDVDSAIKSTMDKVLVLRFGRETDAVCLQLDEIVSAQDPGYKYPPISCYTSVYGCVIGACAVEATFLKDHFFLSWPRTR